MVVDGGGGETRARRLVGGQELWCRGIPAYPAIAGLGLGGLGLSREYHFFLRMYSCSIPSMAECLGENNPYGGMNEWGMDRHSMTLSMTRYTQVY